MKKLRSITKSDVLSFLGLLLMTLITTLISRKMQKNDISCVVQEVLAEERKQIAASQGVKA